MIMVIYYQIKLANVFAMKIKDLLEILRKKDANAVKIPGTSNLTLISNHNLIFKKNVWVAIKYTKDVNGAKTLNHSLLVL